jgi:NAD(P)-dependent dehydrogenase (short-subunit alcohol dehydrogenase family)
MSSSKIALVTGGSRGLGKNMATRLAEKGFDVIITYQSRKEAADEVVKEIESIGRKSSALQFDAADFKSLDSFLKNFSDELQRKWNTSRFDFLVNNAGMGATIPFEQVTENDFDRFMNAHFKTVYFLTQRASKMMNDGGRVVNISTGTTRFCVPGYSVYASMKGAVEVLTRYLAKDLGAKGISVNVVAPGPIETDFNNAALRDNPERRKAIAANTALGRTGQAEDIGGIVAFLCTEDGRWITGQRIEATGGINL